MSNLVKIGKAPDWSGYDLDRIVYEKAVLLARIEAEKDRLVSEGDRMRAGNVSMSRSFFSRMLGFVSYTDFFVLGVRIWRIMAPLFKKKK